MISNNNNNDNNDDNSNNGNLKVNILRRGPSCPPFPRRYGTWSVKTEDLERKPSEQGREPTITLDPLVTLGVRMLPEPQR